MSSEIIRIEGRSSDLFYIDSSGHMVYTLSRAQVPEIERPELDVLIARLEYLIENLREQRRVLRP